MVCTAASALLGCNAAYGDRIAEPPRPRPVEQVVQARQQQGPYTLEILTKRGETLPTHAHNGRFYVQGSVGARYVIRVTNPTERRVEAVVSVDGLDVIDGKAADFGSKRGYVVPPHGEVRIEGWRTSTNSVATFRFSSVSQSYAGRKGVPRNVGVIGVAIFEEKAAPQVIVQEPPRPGEDLYFDDVDDGEWNADDYWGGGGVSRNKSAPRGGARTGSTGSTGSTGKGRADSAAPEAEEPSAPAPTRGRRSVSKSAPSTRDERCCTEKRESRPGLGTEFGEARRSAVSWTRFERNNLRVPDATAELRYNDTDGLRAMGIAIGNPVTWGEIETRETANPFPNSSFSSPPR